MKVPIRKTISGTEYWDTEAKRTLFVPKGEKPKFEVTENPKSMIGGVDLATGKDLTVTIDGTDVAAKVSEVIDKAKADLKIDTDIEVDLDEMNAEQLKAFAEQNGIDVPGTMKKENTIRNHIAEQLTADSE